METGQDDLRQIEAGPLAGESGYRDAEPARAPALWCRWCGRAARRVGVPGSAPEMGKTVHDATGRERGEDGHLVAPQDYEPPNWKAARELEDEFGRVFKIDARFGVLRADWADAPGPGFMIGKTAGELRPQLAAALDSAQAAAR